MNVMMRTVKLVADIISGLTAANVGFNEMLGFDLLAQPWLEGVLTPLRVLIGISGLISLVFGVMNIFDVKCTWCK